MARKTKKDIKVVSLQSVKCDGVLHAPGGGPWDCPADQFSRLDELGAVAPHTPEPDLGEEAEDSGDKDGGE